MSGLIIRLNKYISSSGVCARRKADELILAGKIQVNNTIIKTLGYKVNIDCDVVKYNGKVISYKNKYIYILFNKPFNCITTSYDPQRRKTIFSYLPKNITSKYRLFHVGRLDRNTTGLILLTNDGFLARELSHPSSCIEKKYKVLLNRDFEDRDKVLNGVILKDGICKLDDVKLNLKNKRCVFVTLHSGKNRILRRLFQFLGYKIIKLERYSYANLTKGDLKSGQYKILHREDIMF